MPKIVDRDARQREIARAVLRVVAREGVRGVTIREAAHEAGWSTGVIHHYFGDKQGLLVGAVNEAGRLVSERIAEVLTRADPMDRLLALLEAGMPLDDERAAMCRIFFYFWSEGIADATLGAALAEYYALWRDDVRATIQAAQADGRFAGHDPARLSQSLVGLAEGLGVQSMFDPVAVPATMLRDHLTEVVGRLAAATVTI